MANLFSRQRIFLWGAFALILLVGGAFRFQASNWDQGQLFHPDERAIILYTQPLNSVQVTGNPDGGRKSVSFPPGGLSFFIPNDKTSLRPPTELEISSYNLSGGNATLPPNVVAPDKPVPPEAINFWNASFSPLNPRWFAYGTFPMYLIKFVGWAVGNGDGDDFNHLIKVGRFNSAMFSMGTLVLVFVLARLLFQPVLGQRRSDILALLAMAFLSVTVLDIQLAHYAAFDVPLTFFITLTLVFAVRLMQTGQIRFAALSGLAIGLALASKISAAPVVLSVVAAALLYGFYGRSAESGESAGRISYRALPGRETDKYGENAVALGRRLIWGSLLNLVIAGLVALVVWFIAMPYAFLDFSSFSSRVIEEGGMSRGVDSFPYTRQYVGTIPVLYQISQLVQWAASIPLGILMLLGLGYSLWQMAYVRLKGEIILFAFFLPYSLITFSAEAKFNRYMLPVMPLLVIFAARLVVELATHAPAFVGRFNMRKWVAAGAGGLALVWALGWAISFSQIYNVEHPMNQATRWMFANIPSGKSISHEIWDESLPTPIIPQGIGSKGWCDPETLTATGNCVHVDFDIYGDQSPQTKAEYFVEQVRKTDYILLASNRLYATMPKLPWRYPVQIRFYELLFAGKLGYEQVGTFTAYPKLPLLNLEIKDDSADESFTVYDHPKVMIFKKTQQLTDEELRGLFAASTRATWIPQRSPKLGELPTRIAGRGDGVLESATAGQVKEDGKSLLLDEPVDRLPVIDDIGWFKFANDNQWFAVLLWYLLFQIIGLIGLPLAWRVCRHLPDRGYIIAKPLGAVLIALVIWLLVWTRFFMNTVWTAWLALALVALFAGWLYWRNRDEINDWLLANRRLILLEEVIFLTIFVGWIFFRLGNPDLWHPYYGGEKPMEMTHLQGILKSAYFPPYDPWFADGYINYYYYGQYLVSTWLKLSGINPYIGFNLAVPVVYAFVCTAGFSLVFNLTKKYKESRARYDLTIDPEKNIGPIIAGLFGVIIFALIGNFDGFLQLLQRIPQVAEFAASLKLYPEEVETLKKFDYFRSSRVIPGTINEFPAFSFVYSDLHAHVIALPYTLIAMLLGFNLVATDWSQHSERGATTAERLWHKTIGRLWTLFDNTLVIPVALMAVIGFLAATNSWDLPTYLLVIAASIFMGLFRRNFEDVRLRASSILIDVGLTGLLTGAILAGAYGLYWNFFSHFQAFFTKVELLPDRLTIDRPWGQTTISARTELPFFLVIFLLPTLLIVSYLIWNIQNWWRQGVRDTGLRPPDDPWDEVDYDEDEEEDETTLDELAEKPLTQPVTKTAPGFGFWGRQARPQLAFALGGAGADGGSDEDELDDPGQPELITAATSKPNAAKDEKAASETSPSPSGEPTNRLAKIWLTAVGAVCGFGLLYALVVPNNWLVFGLSVTVLALVSVLLVVRAFDRREERAAEARSEATIFAGIMLVAGFGIVAATDVVFLKDDMCCGEYTRMNTIFKFYYQVWALVTLAAAFAGYVVWTRWISGWRTKRPTASTVARFGWIGALVIILFCNTLWPVQAIPVRLAERASDPLPGPTLDGREYYKTLRVAAGVPNMPNGKYFDHFYEAQSLFEFYDKIKGTPVVLQASIWPYRGGGSWIAINTGLPLVQGWDHHSRQQRWPEMVSNRSTSGGESGIVRQIYNTASIQEALDLLVHFHVTYIHLGVIEREGEFVESVPAGGTTPYMSEEGYAKFEQMLKLGLLQVAYQNPGVIVYKLTPKGESGVISGDVSAVGGNVTVVDPRLRRLEEAVKAQPTNPQAHYNLGQYYASRKQFDKAITTYQQVILLEPNRVNPYHVLGDAYRDNGELEKALETYQKATKIKGPAEEMPPAFNKYGVALQAAGNFDEALTQFSKVIELNPRFNEAYFHKAEIYEAQGKKQQAIEAYQQTVANSTKSDDFWALRATSKIRELGGK